MRRSIRGYEGQVLTLAASGLWGTSFVGVKFGLRGLDPLWFLQWRMSLAAAILLLLFGRRDNPWRYLREPRIWILSALMMTGFAFQFVGMQYTTASASAFLINFGIVFVAILSYLYLGEPFGRRKIAGLFFAVAGAYLLATGAFWSWTWERLRGDVLVLISGLWWAAFTVTNKTALNRSDLKVIPLTTFVILLGAGMLLPFAALFGRLPSELHWQQVGVISYLALFCTVLPFLFWLAGLRHLTPTMSAAVLLAEPVFAALFAFALLNETLELSQWIGAALILMAIGLVSISAPARRPLSEALLVE
jgi:drug/metabolite transporter (DMT)-like permease